jgi:acetolactate synthase-1/2/3 large subunit
MPTCGEKIVELIEGYGIDTVFGIPGVHTLELYRGLGRSGIRHITPRHEQGAGFMADGYARAAGKPAACFIISGPGMTNIITALGQAYADSVPMLVISSVTNTEQLGLGQGRLHELPHQRNLVSGVAAFSHTLMRPAELPEVLARAFTVFRSQRPRPVHIEIPIDVLEMPADSVSSTQPTIPKRPGPNPDVIRRAAEMLRSAKDPMVWLGGGAKDAAAESLRLVELLDAPTVNTTNGSGVLPTNHPLCVGLNIGFRVVAEALKKSDVVLAVGTEISETDTFIDGLKFEFEGKLIRIDIDPQQLSRNWPAELAILSDARLALDALNQALGTSCGTKPLPDSEGRKRAAELHRQVKDSWWPECAPQKRLMDTTQKASPGMIIVGDSTQLIYNTLHCLECGRPRSFFHSATGFGTLGYALPAAIGAKLAQPARPVAAVIGDGGIQFTLPELASAVEARIPVVVLLWNNGGFGEIRRCMRAREIPPIGTQAYTPDFLAIAKGFGCSAERASGYEHLDELLRKANRADMPTLIEIREDAQFLTID